MPCYKFVICAHMPRLSSGDRPFEFRMVGSAPERSSNEISPACFFSIAICSGLSPGGNGSTQLRNLHISIVAYLILC